MSDQDSSKMRVSERNETCLNCRTEAVSHLQNAKTQNYKNTKMQKRCYINFSNWQRKRTYFAAKNEYGKPKIGAALPLYSPSAVGRQKKWPPIRAAIYSMYQALASISGDDQIFRTTLESIFIHFTTFGNGYACEVGTTIESPFMNIRY